MSSQNSDPSPRPLLTRVVDDFALIECKAVTDPAELANPAPQTVRPIWSAEVDDFALLEDRAVTDPKELTSMPSSDTENGQPPDAPESNH
jgi:hypothetical protein